ncbi:MAG TPA: hypothetical protein VFV50_08770 [Bdellovibrionales bacterium]|nr:hypothetical protein [Bdellovibrionales bacterium]
MNKLVCIFSLIVLISLSLPAQAQNQQQGLPVFDKDFACTPQATAQRYISDFRIDVKSFGGMELCNSKVDLKKLLNDITIIEQGRFDTSKTNLLIRDYVKADQYYAWMKAQTRGINRGDDIPYATAYNSFGYFTMQDGWATLSTLGRVGTVIHEARHTEGYRHIPCTHGPYGGASTAGCDRDYAYGGSHAIEMEYYGRVVAQGTNFHPVYKSMARLMAMGRSNFVFNESPIRVREVLTILGKDARPAVLDGDRLLARDGLTAAGGALKRTSHGAAVFMGSATLTLDLYSRLGGQTGIQDDYSYFKLLLLDRGQGPEPLRDMEEVDIGSRRFAVGLKRDNTIASYLFTEGKWSPFQQPVANAAGLVTTLATGEKGVFLRTNDGTIIPYDPARRAYGEPLKTKWPAELVSAASVNGHMLALRNDGTVYLYDGRNWSAVPALQKIPVAQMVSSPVYDAFEVAP